MSEPDDKTDNDRAEHARWLQGYRDDGATNPNPRECEVCYDHAANAIEDRYVAEIAALRAHIADLKAENDSLCAANKLIAEMRQDALKLVAWWEEQGPQAANAELTKELDEARMEVAEADAAAEKLALKLEAAEAEVAYRIEAETLAAKERDEARAERDETELARRAARDALERLAEAHLDRQQRLAEASRMVLQVTGERDEARRMRDDERVLLAELLNRFERGHLDWTTGLLGRVRDALKGTNRE